MELPVLRLHLLHDGSLEQVLSLINQYGGEQLLTDAVLGDNVLIVHQLIVHLFLYLRDQVMSGLLEQFD